MTLTWVSTKYAPCDGCEVHAMCYVMNTGRGEMLYLCLACYEKKQEEEDMVRRHVRGTVR